MKSYAINIQNYVFNQKNRNVYEGKTKKNFLWDIEIGLGIIKMQNGWMNEWMDGWMDGWVDG